MPPTHAPKTEIVGDPIKVSLFSGGLDSPTFMTRRKIELVAYVELDSVEVYAEHEDAARHLGAELGSLLHQHLKQEQVGS